MEASHLISNALVILALLLGGILFVSSRSEKIRRTLKLIVAALCLAGICGAVLGMWREHLRSELDQSARTLQILLNLRHMFVGVCLGALICLVIYIAGEKIKPGAHK